MYIYLAFLQVSEFMMTMFVAMNDVMYIHAWHCVIFEVDMDDVFVGL